MPVTVGRYARPEANFQRKSNLAGEWQPDPAYEGWLRWGWRQIKWAAFWTAFGFTVLAAYDWRLS